MNAFSYGFRNWSLPVALLLTGALGFLVARLTAPRLPAASIATPSTTTEGPQLLALQTSYLDAVGIQLETVAPGDLGTEIRATASISAAPNGQAAVSAQAAGTVVKIVRQLGDTVRPGETLALVQSRDAAEIAATRAVAESREALARSVYAREKQLYEQHVTARQDLEAAEAELTATRAQAGAARLAAENAHVSGDGAAVRVVSPIGGRLTSATTAVGAFVQADTELFRVADPARIQVEAAVTALDAARVAPGDAATVQTARGQSLPAQVRSITPGLDEKTRSATVVLSFKSADGAPAPGEFVQVVIQPKATASGFVIPEEAVQRIDGRDVVFVKADGGFRVQPVAVATRSGGRAAVLSGLSTGESIATRNAFLLKAELAKGAEEEE